MNRIAVIGTGYVGLATGAGFARLGHHVTCADIDADKVEQLNRGEVTILEPGLPELVRDGLDQGRLRFVVGAAEAARDCEFAYLCVQTPQDPTGAADMQFIEQAARDIGAVLPRGAVVVTKSTVPVGATLLVAAALQRPDVAVVSNPEFLREGSAVRDFLNPTRIVIGADERADADRVASLFREVSAPVIITDPASAETIKYAANSFLATKVSFVNSLSAVCEAVGADIQDVVLGIGTDPRIGTDFLQPGPGWGGSCLPKDTLALVHMAAQAGYDFGLLRSAISANEEQFDRVVAKVARAAGGNLDGCSVAAWGLAFKANTNDLRASPAMAIIARLVAAGAEVRSYDPAVDQVDGLKVVDSALEACDGADALVVLTEWDEFRRVDWDEVGERMRTRTVVDARGVVDRAAAGRAGFTYVGI
jgi:UDPglucose 6-dehydrogenase